MTSPLEFDPQLAPSGSSVSINSYQKLNAEGSLILRPPFQRNLVWNAEQQSFLIDSVLRGLPVPEIYVQTRTNADGTETKTVVDGQQRLISCLRFLQGDLRLASDEDLDPRWRNRTFPELEEALQKRFRSFKLIERELPDVGELTLREVFRRLNKTVEPLLPQELRHAAYTGPLIHFVETAGAYPALSEVGVFTARDYLRRKNDEFMAELVLMLVPGAFPNKKEGLDQMFLTYERQGVPAGVLEALGGRFGRVFAQLDIIGSDLRRTRFRNKSDFYSLFVVLANEAERLPLDQKGSAALLRTLRRFSDRVNEIKQWEGDGEASQKLTSGKLGINAFKYLRSVERAASDRLNRVRRDEVLREVIGPVLAKSEPQEFEDRDLDWMSDVLAIETAIDDEFDDETEKAEAQRVLLESD